MIIKLYYKDKFIKAKISKEAVNDSQRTIKWLLEEILKSMNDGFTNSFYLISPEGKNVDITLPVRSLSKFPAKKDNSFYLGINKTENNTKIKEININTMIHLIKEATNAKRPINLNNNNSNKTIKNVLLKSKPNLSEKEKINDEHLKFLKEIYENGFSLQYNETSLTQLLEMGFNELYSRIALRMNRNDLTETILSLANSEVEIWEQHILLSLPNSDIAKYQTLNLSKLFKDSYEYELSCESEDENEEENEYVEDSNNHILIQVNDNLRFGRGPLNMNMIFQGIGNSENNSESMEEESAEGEQDHDIEIGFYPVMDLYTNNLPQMSIMNNFFSSLSNNNSSNNDNNEEDNSDMNISDS